MGFLRLLRSSKKGRGVELDSYSPREGSVLASDVVQKSCHVINMCLIDVVVLSLM
jgi:hypothetical protein